MPEANPGDALLDVRDLHAYYGASHVLQGIDFSVRRGEVVTLLGRNGAGKTTILRSVIGLVRRRTGTIRVDGAETIGLTADRIARLGLAYCPDERAIFSNLTVAENLELPPVLRPGGLSLAEIYELFPNLKERLRSGGNRLSGGEQQMLAIGRILRTGATILLLDEPTEGLAPIIIEEIGAVLDKLKQRGFTILLVEQNFAFASRYADRHYIVEDGRIVEMLNNADLLRDFDRIKKFLSV
ncbi:MAG: ABC transporter ATP-binding protein [Xanthobacteraceae bacterium]|jgi:branched-chain amino acid transport system ATP-binding protein